MINQLCTDDGRSAIYIVQSDNNDDLRTFSARLASRVFFRRRREGIIRLLVLFVYTKQTSSFREKMVAKATRNRRPLQRRWHGGGESLEWGL